MNRAESTSRPDRLAEIHEQLVAALAQLTIGEDWTRMLETQARFHSYSWQNSLLIRAGLAAQGREQSRYVAGYGLWRSLGRQVQKGERGIPILAPVLVRRPDGPDQEAQEEEQRSPRVLRGFKVAYVWPIEATDGKPLPEIAPTQLQGEAPEGLFERLSKQVDDLGYELRRENCSPANGCTDFLQKTVTVHPDLAPLGACKTLAHEIAHVKLHEELATGEMRRGAACRGLLEVEAESVAYLVCNAAGFSSSEYSFPYIARWAGGDVSLVAKTAERVTRAAKEITAASGLKPEERDPALRALSHARSEAPSRSRRAPSPGRPARSVSAGGRSR